MSLLKYPRCRLSYAKIVQTERYELAQIPEVPPILCKNTENNQLKIEMYWKIFNEHRFFNMAKSTGAMPGKNWEVLKRKKPVLFRTGFGMFVWNKLLFYLSVSLLGFLSVNFGRENGDCALVAGSLVEVNHAISKSIQCVVLALSYILTGEVLVATLANDDVAGDDLLATPNLNA